jgi:formylmethanofuran dehydrogenase subunit B
MFLPIEPQRDFEALWTLRGLIRGIEPSPGADLGAPLSQLRELARKMTSCRFGIAFFGLGLARSGVGHRSVAALLALVTDLNRHTRFYARRMRVSGDVAGADTLLAWQTGYPFAVNLGRGYPRYNPGEFSAAAMLERGEIDAAVLVGSHGVRRFPPAAVAALSRIPTIVLDAPDFESLTPPTVRFTTAVHGVHRPGTAYRMDEVPVPLRPFLDSPYPSDAEVLEAILSRLRPPLELTS